MTLIEIVERGLEKVGADGLSNHFRECGCPLDDLMAGDCEGIQPDCDPSKKGTDEEAKAAGFDEIWYPLADPPPGEPIICPTDGSGCVQVEDLGAEVDRLRGELEELRGAALDVYGLCSDETQEPEAGLIRRLGEALDDLAGANTLETKAPEDMQAMDRHREPPACPTCKDTKLVPDEIYYNKVQPCPACQGVGEEAPDEA